MDIQEKIESILTERQTTHGDFSMVARVAAAASCVFHEQRLSRPEHSVAFQMILLKLARIVSGDADHVDSWLDIAGYAVLAAKSIPVSEES